MKDWTEYSKAKVVVGSSENAKPNVFEYMLIKLTDNSLAASVLFLCILFALIGLFCDRNENTAWTLHASELCSGVFLGLLKKHGR